MAMGRHRGGALFPAAFAPIGSTVGTALARVPP